jgi:flagellar FliL protein
MAASRTEAPRAADEKAPREAASEGAAAPKAAGANPLQTWLPLAVALVVMPVLAYGITSFVLVPKLQKALNAAGPAQPEEKGETKSAEPASGGHGAPASPGQKQNVTINKLLVNVAGTMGSRYLLTSMVLVGDASEFQAKVTENEAQLRDMANGVLSTKTIADLEKPGARNLLRGELLAGFNSILSKTAVREIYFTEFAIQ